MGWRNGTGRDYIMYPSIYQPFIMLMVWLHEPCQGCHGYDGVCFWVILQPRFELGLGFHGCDIGWVVNGITTWVSLLIIEPSTRWGGLTYEYNFYLVISGHCWCCYNNSVNCLALELNVWSDMQQIMIEAVIGHQLYLSFIILGTTLHCTCTWH